MRYSRMCMMNAVGDKVRREGGGAGLFLDAG